VWSRLPTEQVRPTTGTRWPGARVVLSTDAGPVTMIAAHVLAPKPPRFPFVGDASGWQSDIRRVGELSAADEGPRFVIGDLNATPWNAAFRGLAGYGLTDAADLIGRGMRPTWPSWSPIAAAPLDHVMVAGNLRVASVGTIDIRGTDHRALWAELARPPSQ
jgi:endonuclease/exonuclease/phosphatase (EEP) superfamily protein YafD